MRSDMDKLLCERPRRGHGLSHNEVKHGRYYEKMKHEEAPSIESMKPRKGERKYLNENLKPLERFLESRIGRSWDKVYSEIREHFDKSTATSYHIFQHLEMMVEKNAVYRDGKYYRPHASSRKSLTSEVSGLYVDRHGSLRNSPRYARYRGKKELNPNVISIEKYWKIVVVNKCWFIGRFKDLPAEEVRKREYTIGDRVKSYEEKYTPPFVDVFLGRDGRVDAQTCVGAYGERIYCYVMKQLGKRDIKFWKKNLGLSA